MFSKLWDKTGLVGAIFLTILIIALLLGISFLFFSLGYWLITLILLNFFGFVLPFTWTYSCGAWLILIIFSAFMAPGFKAIGVSKNE